MELFIDVRDGTPIYDQICSQIKACIIRGDLKEDEALPSIRGLAKDLRISVITTKRAYDELEKDGFIYTVAGKGCFVAKQDTALVREEHLKRIEEHLRKIRELAAACDLKDGDIAEMYRVIGQEDLQ